MRRLAYATALAIIGFLLEGLDNISLADVVVVLAVPLIFVYVLLGRRPGFLRYVGNAAMFAGALSAIYGFAWAPTRYYYGLWGWPGIVLGAGATLILPLQPVVLLVTAFIKGGAVVPIAKLLSGVCFGMAGRLLAVASEQPPLVASKA